MNNLRLCNFIENLLCKITFKIKNNNHKKIIEKPVLWTKHWIFQIFQIFLLYQIVVFHESFRLQLHLKIVQIIKTDRM